MPIKIIDADYAQLNQVKRAGRARSKDMLDLIKAIEELKPGKAKALVVERGDSAEIPVSFTPQGLGPVGLGFPGSQGTLLHRIVIETDDVDQMTRAPSVLTPYDVSLSP